MKNRSLMLMVLFALSLAALIVLSGAASRAEATDVSATNTVLQQLEDDGQLNSDMKEELEMWNRLENSSGADTASPSAPATTASAAQDQYKELPDTDGKAVAPAETTEEIVEESSSSEAQSGGGDQQQGGGPQEAVGQVTDQAGQAVQGVQDTVGGVTDQAQGLVGGLTGGGQQQGQEGQQQGGGQQQQGQ
jgi:hypothetical protein